MEWLGFPGAPLALAINAWLSFFMLFAYVRTNASTRRCLPDVWGNAELLQGWSLIIRMGAAGAAAMMGVWWSWELLSGMAGILGEIPLAAHVAMQQFGMFFFPFFLGGGMAATVVAHKHVLRRGHAVVHGPGRLHQAHARWINIHDMVGCIVVLRAVQQPSRFNRNGRSDGRVHVHTVAEREATVNQTKFT